MKTIRVAAAVILNAEKQVFATARGYGEQKGGWEFPGGKLEPGETSREAILREIQEELDVTIAVDSLLKTIEFDYPAFHLSMDCFLCHITAGEILLKEAEAARWLTKQTLDSVAWLPADRELIPLLEELLQ